MQNVWIRWNVLIGIVVAAGLVSGCGGLSGLVSKGGTGFYDYALAANGATITASAEEGDHTADKLINGITDGSLWNQGEGWQATFQRTTRRRRNMDYRQRQEDRITRGSAWVKIDLAQPTVVNRVVVHALDTERNPFPGWKTAELQVETPNDTLSEWKTVARIEKGRIVIPGRATLPAKATTTFRFNPIKASAVRFIVFSMQDSRTLERRSAFEQTVETTIRLLEIEVTGTASVDANAPASVAASTGASVRSTIAAATAPSSGSEQPGDEEAALPAEPEGLPVGERIPTLSLTSLTGDPLPLRDKRGAISLIVFWSAADEASVRELTALARIDKEFRSNGVRIIGLALDENDPDSVRRIVQEQAIAFPVALAGNAVTARFHGVPKIPEVYVVGRDGVISERMDGERGYPSLQRAVLRTLNEQPARGPMQRLPRPSRTVPRP